ncbi:Death-associated inhibitor of apoptosis 1 [Bienertia sinuspersici]
MSRIMAHSNGIAYFIYLFMVRLVAYFAVLAILLIITVIAFKYLGEWRERMDLEEGGENSPLMSQYDRNYTKLISTKYGACQNDLETANCNSSSSSNDSGSKYCSELYDAKICIICYDGQRNCFFVPCGHCATCFRCAQRYVCLYNFLLHHLTLGVCSLHGTGVELI